jgi:hypothetical protein
MVYRADRHPGFAGSRRDSQPRREVTGGSFRGTGGRQVMPLPGQTPASDDAEQVPGAATSYYDAANTDGHRDARRAGSTGERRKSVS